MLGAVRPPSFWFDNCIGAKPRAAKLVVLGRKRKDRGSGLGHC